MRDVPPHAGGQDRARRRAHAGARRQDGVLVVPQPARIDQQRQGAQGWQLGRRVVHQLSHRDARTDALRARAGARELRDLPRSARILQRPDARRSACRCSASAVTSRAGTRRRSTTRTRSPPTRATGCSGRSCVNCPRMCTARPPVRPVLHAIAVGDFNARTRRGSSGLLARRCGSARSARADCEPAATRSTNRHTRTGKAGACGESCRSGGRNAAQPVRADVASVQVRRSREQTVSGDPARWQRYQDLRDGVSFTDARYEREIQMARGCSTRQRTTSGFAISATSPITSAPAAS